MTIQKILSLRFGLALTAVLLSFLTGIPAEAGIFGTACQEEFEDSSLGSLYWVWERCSAFNRELGTSDWNRFYYNLKGDNWWLHDALYDPYGYDGSTLDNVDLFYINTHGGTTDTTSVWAMHDIGQRAYSFLMRLGDESRQLSVFASYSCETMKVSDGKVWPRLGTMFRGGLRYIAGSHDTVYDSPSTDEVGEDFADNLQIGYPIKHAWKSGNSDWLTNQDLIVLATGSSSGDCAFRRDYMRWSDYYTFPRLRDGAISWVCWSYWNNL
jgi:hypothetical protein